MESAISERLHLSGDDVAPSAARRFVRESPSLQRLEPERRDDAELLVSELVTNVVRHARTDLDLTVCLRCGKVCLVVADYSDVMPHMRDDPGEGGWGLHLVDQLSDRWGVERHDHGKAVWLELAPSDGVDGEHSPHVDDLEDTAHSR